MHSNNVQQICIFEIPTIVYTDNHHITVCLETKNYRLISIYCQQFICTHEGLEIL